jgi:riboflavin transporter FmnP
MSTRQLSYQLTKTNLLVKVAVLSVIAFILQYFDFAIPFLFPAFLKVDLSDVPAMVGGFALGPAAGVMIQLIKNILHAMFAGKTGMVGEAANFLSGAVMVWIAAAIYQYKKDRVGALVGMAMGTIAMTLVMAFANYYLFIPLYEKVLGFPMSAIISMSSQANAGIVDLKSLVILGITPFNIIKGVMTAAITLLLYKKLSPIIHQ